MALMPSSLVAPLPYLEDDSSLNGPVGHGVHRLLEPFQRQDAIDVGTNFSLSQQLYQRIVHAGGQFGKLPGPDARKDANDGIVLQQRQVHRHRRNPAAGEADRHQSSPPLHQPRHLLENPPADIVETNVDAFATGYRLDP